MHSMHDTMYSCPEVFCPFFHEIELKAQNSHIFNICVYNVAHKCTKCYLCADDVYQPNRGMKALCVPGILMNFDNRIG